MNRFTPGPVVRQTSYALMDSPLLDAFRFPHPHPAVRALVRLGLTARGRVVRFFPPRRSPSYARELPQVRSYPHGYDVAALGTFPEREGALTSTSRPCSPPASSSDGPAAASASGVTG